MPNFNVYIEQYGWSRDKTRLALVLADDQVTAVDEDEAIKTVSERIGREGDYVAVPVDAEVHRNVELKQQAVLSAPVPEQPAV